MLCLLQWSEESPAEIQLNSWYAQRAEKTRPVWSGVRSGLRDAPRRQDTGTQSAGSQPGPERLPLPVPHPWALQIAHKNHTEKQNRVQEYKNYKLRDESLMKATFKSGFITLIQHLSA